MLHYLSLGDWLLWAGCVGVQVWALRRALRALLRTLRLLLAYLLAESAVLLWITLCCSRMTYARAYYLLGIPESLLLSAVAVELASKLMPQYRAWVMRLGPVTIAGPAFLALLVLPPLKAESVLRLGTVAMFCSLILLLVCFALEDSTTEVRRLSYTYAGLLALLAVCAEIQVHYGVIGPRLAENSLQVWVIRHLWPCAWLVGIGVLCCVLPAKNTEIALRPT